MPFHDKQRRMLNDINQQGLIRDPQGSILGYVSENGFIYDPKRTLLGYVSKQGVVRNADLLIVGHVLSVDTFPFLAGGEAFFLLSGTKDGEHASDGEGES